ncbi:MAG: heavy metal translocating P-type ATPase [Desulfarculus sp.]|nr:heavy metal translocating P-type ATPase [Desulfarculus sp.]MBV1739099.1 heavy metal translocating P-type ATPase [Desulfarculus sp.]
MNSHDHMQHGDDNGHQAEQHGSDHQAHRGHQGHGEHAGHQGHGGGGGGHASHHAHMVADFRKRFFVSLSATMPILALSPLIQSALGLGQVLSFAGDSYVLLALASFLFFYGGWPFLKGLVDEVKQDSPGMMTLIALAITVAYAYSGVVALGLKGKVFFWELATLIDIMLLGHWIEMRSVMGASRALEELAKLVPKEAHKLAEDGSTSEVPVSELVQGDKVLIKPGEQIPVDGEVIDGASSINEAMLTGESKPVEKEAGDQVIGGAINGEGSLKVEVQKTGEASFLSQVIKLVEQAQESKSRTQDLANSAAKWLTYIALSAGGLTLAAWLVFSAVDFAFALERTVTVMVITCPHALGLAVPLVVAVSTALAAGNGFLIRNRAPFEQARNIKAIMFDKTGTLTTGEFGVDQVVSFNEEFDEDRVLALAGAVESQSEHPIAQAIAEAAEGHPQPEDFKAIPGKGAQATVEGHQVMVVSPRYLKEESLSYPDGKLSSAEEKGATLAFVLVDGQPVGAVALTDMVRPESKEAVARLKEMGIKVMMITGDNRKVAQAVADELGLDDFFAEVLPEEKAAKVKEVQSRGWKVAMTGDGVNDAPALAQADVGIAIGAGTDVAVETADIVLVKSNPLDALALIELSRATYRKMLQNLFWATGYNALAIPLAAGVLISWGVLLSPAMGAVLMSLSTVIVAINARFLKIDI